MVEEITAESDTLTFGVERTIIITLKKRCSFDRVYVNLACRIEDLFVGMTRIELGDLDRWGYASFSKVTAFPNWQVRVRVKWISKDAGKAKIKIKGET